ncbi:MAG: hypothetical protein FIB05_13795 [Betaproteobacteria bacterium]|nr:hypothetical protein [Betaproteobacteria bacterium]PWB62297.1 MAG: hypothetical protein C3F16_06845 [Betaproteobacteria bacterium]
MANRILSSHDSPGADRCVDVFVRDDGSFGFEEYRRDPEDLRGWQCLNRYGRLAFPTEAEAREAAKSAVPWMSEDAQ